MDTEISYSQYIRMAMLNFLLVFNYCMYSYIHVKENFNLNIFVHFFVQSKINENPNSISSNRLNLCITSISTSKLKGLSHEIEINYKLHKSTEPNGNVNLLQFLKLSFSCIFSEFYFLQRNCKKVAFFFVNGATLLEMSIEVIQYPLKIAIKGN